MKKILVAIEGNIGVGKSTFVGILKNHFKDSSIVGEPIDIWLNTKNDQGENILDLFYKDKKRWAYSFQNLAYLTRMMKIQDVILREPSNIIFLDRSLGTDKNIFEKMLHDDGILDNMEHHMYNLWCDFYHKYVSDNTNQLYIYLKCDPNTAFNRIQKRGRDEEKTIQLDYLEKLHKCHDEWLNDAENIIVIDCDREFENDLEYQKEILGKIESKINELCS